MIVNYSKDIDYHTQINNKFVPYKSCNTTSIVMALKQAKIKLPPHVGQPEDALTELLTTDEAYKIQKVLAPWSIDQYAPQEVHPVLEWGVNKWIGRTVDRFYSNTKIEDLQELLVTGKGVVLSGTFPLPNKELHHIVSLAGYIKEETITHYIIDDPYGNWFANYADPHGNNIQLPIDTFIDIFDKGINQYWTHIIGD